MIRRSFLVGAPLRRRESLRSRLTNLAHVNGNPLLLSQELTSLRAATQTAILVFDRDGSHSPLMERMGWVGLSKRGDSFVRLGDSLLLPRCVRLSYRAICPTCLERDGFSSCDWELRAVKACAVHCTYLIDSCPSCLRRLTWEPRSDQRSAG